MSKQNELIKNTFIIFLGKISTQFLSFFLLPIYTNYLSTGDYGFVDLILTYISLFVPVITIQQEMATFRYLIDYRNDKKKISSIISTSIRNTFIYIALFLILFLIASLFIKIKYSIYILVNIIVCIFANLFLQIARGLGKNIHFSIASFITGLTTFVSNIILICIMNIGAKGMLISMSLANTICIIYLFISLKLHKYFKISNYDKDLSKKMIKYSLPLVPNGISWWFINVSDRTIISLILGVSANGIYAVANKFPSIISSFLGIFNLSWTESASLHINDDDRDEFFSSVANNILKIFSSMCLLLIVVLPLIYKYFIGIKYLDSYNYIPIFLIGTLCSCIVSVYSAIYIAKKMTKQVAYTSIASAIINIVINVIFIKFIGLYAAAISTALSYLIMMIYRHFDLKKYVKIKYSKLIVLSVIIMFILSMTLYYINNFYLNVLNLILVIIYSLIINRNNILIVLKKFKER